MESKDFKNPWLYFVFGLLAFGIYMIVWTVRSAISLPVHESNDYILKYQTADMNINKILENKKEFDKRYNIALDNAEFVILSYDLSNNHSNKKQTKQLLLKKGNNNFDYRISDKKGNIIDNAKVSFLLTRPHTEKEDVLLKNLSFSKTLYNTNDIKLINTGRYTLELKVTIGDYTGYYTIPAYLKA